jgi:hypothetical protein
MNEATFFKCLGYLASPSRQTKLDVELRPEQRSKFESRYENITGIIPIPDNINYYLLQQNADKWGVELRIYFVRNENIPDELDTMVVSPRPDQGYNARINNNNNNFIWQLIEYGFRLGNSQDINLIKQKVPLYYRTDFVDGFNL